MCVVDQITNSAIANRTDHREKETSCITTFMVQLQIQSLFTAAWKIFGFQYDQCVADRNRFVAKLQRRLGRAMADQIQNHVDISLGRVFATPDDNVRNCAHIEGQPLDW